MLSADKKNGIMKAMETIIKKIDKNQIDEDAIREAGEILREGGLVAFPTETVYGGIGGRMHWTRRQRKKHMKQRAVLLIIH